MFGFYLTSGAFNKSLAEFRQDTGIECLYFTETQLDLLPLNALLGVLQLDAHGLQLITDAIRFRPVLGGTSGLTVGDHLLYLFVQALLLPAVQQTQHIGELMHHVPVSYTHLTLPTT